MIELSIVILTFNHLSDTVRCLDSLKEMLSADDVEVIVVDNGSNDGTPQTITRRYPKIRLTVNDRNRGVAAARNQGIEQAQGKKVLILDNDTIVNTKALRGMMQYLDDHDQVGLCSCRMTDALGYVQPSYRPFPSLKSKVLSFIGLRLAKSQFSFDDEGAIEPFYVIGACQMIRREALEQVGALDEAIFYGPEDADFCLRLRQAGWQIKYLPQYSIIHTYYRRTAHRPFSRLGLKHIHGLLHLYRKHRRLS